MTISRISNTRDEQLLTEALDDTLAAIGALETPAEAAEYRVRDEVAFL